MTPKRAPKSSPISALSGDLLSVKAPSRSKTRSFFIVLEPRVLDGYPVRAQSRTNCHRNATLDVKPHNHYETPRSRNPTFDPSILPSETSTFCHRRRSRGRFGRSG
jgi:hypothetical protein